MRIGMMLVAAVVLIGAVVVLPARTEPAAGGSDPSAWSEEDRIGYAVGYSLGRDILATLRADGVEGETEQVIYGFSEALRERRCLMTEEELDDLLIELDQRVLARETERLYREDPVFRALADDNLARSRAFQEAFGEREGVVTLPSGVQYRVLEAGMGPSPGAEDTVILNFHGVLTNGTEFDSGRSEEVEVDEMLAGGRELLPLMKVGARWQVAIPPERALGLAGRGSIGPNETLVFEVELLGIK